MLNRPALSLVLGLALIGATAAQTPKKKAAKSAASSKPAAGPGWREWGGPARDFKPPSTGLADTWPQAGPRRIWSRTLGQDGYSPIAVESGVLYTMYRQGAQDVAVALDATTGKTIWEQSYDQPFTNAYSDGVGPGPYAMPQVIGDRVITAGGAGKFHALDKKTGKVLWSHDLYREYGGTYLDFGYSCHALPYKDTLIMLVGGNRSAIMAFRQSDGSVVWGKNSFTNAHSSPVLIRVNGQEQVVALTAQDVFGFDPNTGDQLWRHKHPTQNGLAVSTPVWGDGNLLYISSAYEGGSRVLHLSRSGNTTSVKELWHERRLLSHFGSLIRLGDTVYISSGHNGPTFLSAVDVRTGKTAWQSRDFAKAQMVYADGKFILLDQDGNLGLGKASPGGFQVLAKVPLLTRFAWTPPTLVGTTLYVRDRKTIMALDVGRPAGS